MSKAKYIVMSGFLGAGKTTSMIAIADVINKRGEKAAILADDLGAKNIVDAEFTSTTDILSEQISGDCICYQHENLVDKLNRFVKEGATVIFSDIPGCGIGALDNVYLQLEEREPGEFDLMPFTCIVDPERLQMIMPDEPDLDLPDEMKFLLKAQMNESDLIILNKKDLLDSDGVKKRMDFIRSEYPETPVMVMSALTGEGVEDVADYLLTHKAAAEHKEIGYGSEEFIAAESKLSWYNRRFFLEERDNKNIDLNKVFEDLFEEIRSGLKKNNSNVPHLKMFASSDEENSDFYKASLIDVNNELEVSSQFRNKYNAMSAIINARAAAESDIMGDIVDDALDTVSGKYNLKIKTFFLENFGMMEEGKGNGGRASRY